jgi:hypothetical protein
VKPFPRSGSAWRRWLLACGVRMEGGLGLGHGRGGHSLSSAKVLGSPRLAALGLFFALGSLDDIGGGVEL